VVTIFLFGVASFSLLGASKIPLTASGSSDSALPSADCNLTFVGALTSPPSLVALNIPLLSPTQDPSASNTVPTEDGAGSGLDWSPDREVGATAAQTSHISSARGLSTDEARPSGRSESQRLAADPSPVVGEGTNCPESSPNPASTAVNSDKERDRLFPIFEIQHNQQGGLDHGNLTSREKTLAQHVHNRRSDHSLRAADNFRDRISYECGPINDLDLRRNCIASFRPIIHKARRPGMALSYC
jgi:hypothetical protein